MTKFLSKLAWNWDLPDFSFLSSLEWQAHTTAPTIGWDRVSLTSCPHWPWTMILPISTSRVAKITGVSQSCLAMGSFLKISQMCCALLPLLSHWMLKSSHGGVVGSLTYPWWSTPAILRAPRHLAWHTAQAPRFYSVPALCARHAWCSCRPFRWPELANMQLLLSLYPDLPTFSVYCYHSYSVPQDVSLSFPSPKVRCLFALFYSIHKKFQNKLYQSQFNKKVSIWNLHFSELLCL
jgi:hypothetical protein